MLNMAVESFLAVLEVAAAAAVDVDFVAAADVTTARPVDIVVVEASAVDTAALAAATAPAAH